MAPTLPGDVDREDRTRTSESSNAGVEGIQAMLSRVDMKGSPYSSEEEEDINEQIFGSRGDSDQYRGSAFFAITSLISGLSLYQ